MSEENAAAEGVKKTRKAAEKGLQQVFETAEAAKAAIPEGSKKLRVMKFICKLGTAFVAATKLDEGLAIFSKLALQVVCEDSKTKKVKPVKVKDRLADIIKEAEAGGGTMTTAEVLGKMKSIQEELNQARERHKAKKAAAAAAAANAAPEVPATV